jgi:DNA-binding CsgD family transcriptional regulator
VTSAEATLASQLATHPRSLRETADHLGMSINIAKTQLQRAFDKTGTHRQSEPIKLIVRLSI